MRSKTRSLVAVLALALAVGLSATTVSVVSRMVLRPLRVIDPERLVVVEQEDRRRPGAASATHQSEAYELVRGSNSFGGVLASATIPTGLEIGDQVVPTAVAFISDNYFSLLGLQPEIGSLALDGGGSAAPVPVVLSNRFWLRQFAGDPAVLGRSIRMSGVSLTILGVAPRGFSGLRLDAPADAYVPLDVAKQLNLSAISLTIVGRLRQTRDTTLGHLNAYAKPQLAQELSFGLRPLATAALPAQASRAMRGYGAVVGGAVLLVLFAGGLTVATLLVMGVEDRRADYSTCLALGAPPSRIAMEVIAEGTVLGVAATLLAVPIAYVSLWLADGFELPGKVSLGTLQIGLDGQFLASLSVVAALVIVGMATAAGLVAGRVAKVPNLRNRYGDLPGSSLHIIAITLVVLQVTGAMALLLVGVAFMDGMTRALDVNKGIPVDRLLVFRTAPGHFDRYDIGDVGLQLSRVGGVESVGMSWFLSALPGRIVADRVAVEVPDLVSFVAVDDQYFGTLGLVLTSGRTFGREDHAASQPVSIVSASLANALGGSQNAVGRELAKALTATKKPIGALAVVGVVGDLHTTVAARNPLVVYVPKAQAGRLSAPLVTVRTGLTAAQQATERIRKLLTTLNPTVSVPNVESIDAQMREQLKPQWLGMFLLLALGGLAVVLAGLGVYVLTSATMIRRRREFAIRAAVGAPRRQLAWLAVASTAKVIVIGLVGGLLTAALAAGTVRSLIFGVSPLQADGVALVLLILLSSLVLAGFGPVWAVRRVGNFIDLIRY